MRWESNQEKKFPNLVILWIGISKQKKVENYFLISVSPKIMLGLIQWDKLTTVLTYQHLWKHWGLCPQRSVLLQTEVHWAPLTPMALISGETRSSTQIIAALGRGWSETPRGTSSLSASAYIWGTDHAAPRTLALNINTGLDNTQYSKLDTDVQLVQDL